MKINIKKALAYSAAVLALIGGAVVANPATASAEDCSVTVGKPYKSGSRIVTVGTVSWGCTGTYSLWLYYKRAGVWRGATHGDFSPGVTYQLLYNCSGTGKRTYSGYIKGSQGEIYSNNVSITC